MKRDRWLIRAWLLCLSLLVAGCLGPGPVERTLLVEPGPSRGGEAANGTRLAADLPVLALLPLEASAGLDRRAVGIRQGQAMTSSSVWSWPDSPRRLLAQALRAALVDSGRWNVLTPYHPRAAHAAVLGGVVEDFSMVLDGPDAGRVVARLRLELWAWRKERMLAVWTAEGSAPCAVEAGAVAEAGGRALRQAMEQAVQGLEPWRGQLRTVSSP